MTNPKLQSAIRSVLLFRELESSADFRCDPSRKPPFSYAALICLAMRDSAGDRVTLSQIYAWIKDNFAYYRGSDTSWQVMTGVGWGGGGRG